MYGHRVDTKRVMASQPVSDSRLVTLEVESFIRGYHVYKDKWIPFRGEVLRLRREPNNVVDKFAVAVTKSGQVAGQGPYNLDPTFSHFLNRDVNKAVAEVTGDPVNTLCV